MNASSPFIRLSDCHYDGLVVPEWSISPGEGWGLFGLNGAGKKVVDQLLVGEIAPQTGSVEHSLGQQDIALISFERQQAIYEEEWRLAATDIIPEDEWGTRVADFLPSSRLDDPLIDALNTLVSAGKLASLPLKQKVAAVSVGIYNGQAVLDLDYPEDSAAETDMNVIMNDKGGFIEIQGTAEGEAFSDEHMMGMLAVARKGIAEIIEAQRAALFNK